MKITVINYNTGKELLVFKLGNMPGKSESYKMHQILLQIKNMQAEKDVLGLNTPCIIAGNGYELGIKSFFSTPYRQKRFNNRRRGEGWLAPSIRQKINTHLVTVDRICEILPVSRIIVETASFDMQKIKNPEIQGVEYQQGEQMDFWNVREYVLFRDGHICQCCKGKKKDPILNVHHIESRKTGGDAPNNLITLCETCHKGYHNGAIKLPKEIKRGMRFKDAAFMGIMRWAFYNTLKEKYEPDIPVSMTYGYLTKNTRIRHDLPKEHYTDARCISGNPDAVSDGTYYYQKKVRCHNRQIHKFSILRNGIRKPNQAEYFVKGYRIFDKVKYQGKEYFVFGRRKTGFFDIRTLSGEKVNKGSLSVKKITFVDTRKNYITEKRMGNVMQAAD